MNDDGWKGRPTKPRHLFILVNKKQNSKNHPLVIYHKTLQSNIIFLFNWSLNWFVFFFGFFLTIAWDPFTLRDNFSAAVTPESCADSVPLPSPEPPEQYLEDESLNL